MKILASGQGGAFDMENRRAAVNDGYPRRTTHDTGRH